MRLQYVPHSPPPRGGRPILAVLMAALLTLAAIALVVSGCTATVKPNTTGTVLSKSYDETVLFVVRGRVLTKTALQVYLVVIRVMDGADGDVQTYPCVTNRSTWDGLVEGSDYQFTIVDTVITKAELIE